MVQTVPRDGDNGRSAFGAGNHPVYAIVGHPAFTILGLFANMAATTTQVIGGGRLLVWTLAAIGLGVGLVGIRRNWGRPFSLWTALALTAVVLGVGVLGFAVGETLTRNSIETATQTSTGPGPATESAGNTPPPETTTKYWAPTEPTTTTERTTTHVTTTTPSVQVPPRMTSGGEALYDGDGPFDIDEDGTDDLDVADYSINAANQAQFSTKIPGQSEPTHAGCMAIPADQWRTSVPLEDFRDGATYCLRTGSGHPGFFVVEKVEMYLGTIFEVHSHWTIWE